jgi:hypothetical protein
MDESLFNENARRIIIWTREQLNETAISFLKTLPLSINAGMFRCSHGDFSEPAAFHYVIDPEDALPSWESVDTQLLFTGHTHNPQIFLLGPSNIPRTIDPEDFELEPGKRYLVNVGSVGHPRDGDFRGNYCVYDTDANAVFWHNVMFDLDAYRSALINVGIPHESSYFLGHDPRIGRPPLRELLNFSPAANPQETVQNAVAVEDIQILHRSITKWKILALLILCLAVSLILGFMIPVWKHKNRGMVLSRDILPLSAVSALSGKDIITMPEEPVPAHFAVPKWTINLGDKREQQVQVVPGGESGNMFSLSSGTIKDPIKIDSCPVTVKPGMKFQVKAYFLKAEDFIGNVSLAVTITKKSENIGDVANEFIIQQPNLKRKDGWMLAQRTFTLPADGESIQINVGGKFRGKLLIRDISLQKKE